MSKELLFILLFFFRCKYFFVVTSNVRLVRSLTFFFYFAKTGLRIKYRAWIDGYISKNIILINDNAYSSLQILITLQFRLIILINLTPNFSHIQIVDSFIPCQLIILRHCAQCIKLLFCILIVCMNNYVCIYIFLWFYATCISVTWYAIECKKKSW